MVLVAVDDLLFSSKIRASAKHAGVDLLFARTPADVLARARSDRPSLVIVDLDCAKVDPVATISAMKSDAALAGLPILAFASHVHAALIAAARRAGAEQVLPRSAFAANLGDILLSHGGQRREAAEAPTTEP
jgi:DNA-binding NarL/FixJ family response regulator